LFCAKSAPTEHGSSNPDQGTVVTKGAYFGLKLSILLSLLHSRLDIMTVGCDTVIIDALYKYSQKLFSGSIVDRTCIQHSPNLNELYFKVKKDLNQNAYCLEAGSLVLANNGVCYLGMATTKRVNLGF
jgi:DNA replicative helicase MCM subunit Mcm2 (Cdc46/Mcm family)